MSVNFLINFGRRLAYPFLAKRSDDIIDSTLNYAITSPSHLDDFVSEGTQTMHQWLRDPVGEKMLGGTWKRFKQELLDPETVIGGTDAGRRMIDAPTFGHLEELKMLHKYINESSAARGGIRKGTDESARVFEALENPQLVGGLAGREKTYYDYLSNLRDFTHKIYTRHLLDNDDAAYNKVMKLAAQGTDADPATVGSLSQKEAIAYDWAKRKIKDYAPHLWEREQLIETFENKVKELLIKQSETGGPEKFQEIGGLIKQYEESLVKLKGGNPLVWETLPTDFLFKHELIRKGAKGYQVDAVKTFDTYMFSLAKKMYREPAIKTMMEAYKELPWSQRPFARWFIRDIAGYNTKSVWDDIGGQIASFEYMRTLGWNLRSPIVNLTQQVNTIIDAGLKWSKVGYMKFFDPEMKVLWEKSGLGLEIPQALVGDLGPMATRVDKLRRVLGFFFNKAEEYNRRHAFNTYYSKFEHLGGEEAMKRAIKGVYKVQFQYGIVGMPKLLRTAPGRVGLQYSSFSIKQAQLLHKWMKEDPKKLLMWVGATAGMNYTFQDLLGLDMANVFGFGANLAQGIEMVRSATQGEFEDAWLHGRMTFAQGTGILPSGPGPAVTGLVKVVNAIMKGEKVPETVWKELKPVVWQRVDDLLQSLTNKALAPTPGKYPLFKRAETLGELAPSIFGEARPEFVMEQSLKNMLQRQLIRPTEETKKQAEWYGERLFDRRDTSRKQEIARLIVAGKGDRASELIRKWKVVPTRDAIYEEFLRKNVPREQRRRYIMQQLRQHLREVEEE